MIIYPAIDLFRGEAVRLYKGDYNQKTVYSSNPVEIALDFRNSGADHMHIVDLEGAKTGTAKNLEVIKNIKKEANLFCEVGGGIRDLKAIEKYLNLGIDRVILGTAAVTDPEFTKKAVREFKEKISIGIDIKNNKPAIHGWTEEFDKDAFTFCMEMESIGVKTIICTDISKDGAMQGTNIQLYKDLSKKVRLDIIASGGISTLDDIKALRELDIYGTIIGKAYYSKAINLKEAIEVAK